MIVMRCVSSARELATCTRGPEVTPVGYGHGDNAQDEADDAEEDHRPAEGCSALPCLPRGPLSRSGGTRPPHPTSPAQSNRQT